MAVARPRSRVEPVYPDQVKVTPELARRIHRAGKYGQDPTRYDNRTPVDLSVTEPKLANLSASTRVYQVESVTEPKLATASVSTRTKQDYSTTNAKLATNAGDSRTQQDNSITTNYNSSDGTTSRSHLGGNAVGRRELQSDASNNNFRAVGRDHMRDGLLASRHFPTTVGPVVSSADVASLFAGKLTGTDQIPSSMVIGLATGKLTGTINLAIMDNDTKNAAQSTASMRSIAGSGNGTQAAAWNHTHSYSFKHLPIPVQERVIGLRSRIRKIARDTGKDADTRALAWGQLVVMTLLFDEEDGMSAEERIWKMKNEPGFYKQWRKHELIAVMPDGTVEDRPAASMTAAPFEDLDIPDI